MHTMIGHGSKGMQGDDRSSPGARGYPCAARERVAPKQEKRDTTVCALSEPHGPEHQTRTVYLLNYCNTFGEYIVYILVRNRVDGGGCI